MKIDRYKINRLQDENLLTGRKLAEKAGLSEFALYSAKRRGSCSPETAGRIATALKVSVAEIMPNVRNQKG